MAEQCQLFDTSKTGKPPGAAADGAALSVVLTGFMGSGQTTVGPIIAQRLGFGFVDTDQIIESRAGPIPEIFKTQGEWTFRRLEEQVSRELAGRGGLVIATGGRTMLDPVNARCLEQVGKVVCLTAAPETIIVRVTHKAASIRPLLDGDDPAGRVSRLLAKRLASYSRFPMVATDGRSPEQVAGAVIDLLGL